MTSTVLGRPPASATPLGGARLARAEGAIDRARSRRSDDLDTAAGVLSDPDWPTPEQVARLVADHEADLIADAIEAERAALDWAALNDAWPPHERFADVLPEPEPELGHDHDGNHDDGDHNHDDGDHNHDGGTESHLPAPGSSAMPSPAEQIAIIAGFVDWLRVIEPEHSTGAENSTGAEHSALAQDTPECADALGEIEAGPRLTDADRIDQLAGLRALSGAIEAAQARLAVALDESQQAAAVARGGSARQARRGIGTQIGLARGVSPSAGSRLLALAHALRAMPTIRAALTAGQIGQAHVAAIMRATTGLTEQDRQILDVRLGAVVAGMNPYQAGHAADAIAAELDPQAIVDRHDAAVKERGVWTRPAPAGMAYLTVLAPLTGVVGAYASLTRYATATAAGHTPDDPPGERTYSQILADTAIRWLSGLTPGQAQPVALNLVMPAAALFAVDPDGFGSADSSSPAAARDDRSPGSYPLCTLASFTTSSAAAKASNPSMRTPESSNPRTGEPASTEPASPETEQESTDPAPHRNPGGDRNGRESGASGNRAFPRPVQRPGSPGEPPRSEAAAVAWSFGPNTPARIVGHGHLPAPLARALLLCGCPDDPDEGGGTDPTGSADSSGAHPAIDEFGLDLGNPGLDWTSTAAPPSWAAHPAPDGTRAGEAGNNNRQTDWRSGAWQSRWASPAPPRRRDSPAAVWLRRIFVGPSGRDLVALESTARLFPPGLRRALLIRDDRCRIPMCSAPARHADHVVPASELGPTSLRNAEAASADCNYLKDLPGFSTRVLTPNEIRIFAAGPAGQRNTVIAGTVDPDTTHVTAFTTPTGHTYLSAAPAILGGG